MAVHFAKTPTYSIQYKNIGNFGKLTVGHKVAQRQATRTNSSTRTYTDADVQQKYGANNVYQAANQAVNTLTSVGNVKNTALNSIGSVSLGKTSEQVLSSINNSKNYTELKAAKAEMKQGQGNLIKGHNESISSYIDSTTQNILQELGVNVVTLSPIDGKYEKYNDDQKILDSNKDKCQQTLNNCNSKLPEVTEQLASAEAKVATQSSIVTSLENQIEGMKKANQDTSAVEAQLENAKAELKKAEEERDKFQMQKDALESAMSQCDSKKELIDENKKDLENYHKAEGSVMDKTFDIARKDDKEVGEHIKKLKKKKQEIEKEIKNNSKNSADNNHSQNGKIERLQGEYTKMAQNAGVVFADLKALISDNDGQKVVKNSKLSSYTIKNFDEIQNLLETDNS